MSYRHVRATVRLEPGCVSDTVVAGRVFHARSLLGSTVMYGKRVQYRTSLLYVGQILNTTALRAMQTTL